MIGKIVSRKSKNIGSKIEGIFSESKQIIFLCVICPAQTGADIHLY